MRVCIFDTETTGLPKTRDPACKGPNNWPHLVSISWVILDSVTNKIEKKRYSLIKPMGWDIPEESIKIHGITYQKAYTYGKDLHLIMMEFLSEVYDVLVAHNIEFDFNVIYNAIRWDLNIEFSSLYRPMYCTMEISKPICKIRSMYGTYKSPKLVELYEFVTNKKPVANSLHNSLYDTMLLTEIIQASDAIRSKMNLPPKPVITSENANQKNATGVLSL